MSQRRRSEGDVRIPVKHKPPHSPHSRSTTSSPLMNKKHDTTKRPLSPSLRRDSSPATVRREPSPPSSGESENSSVVSESAAIKVTTSLVVKERVGYTSRLEVTSMLQDCSQSCLPFHISTASGNRDRPG